MIARIFVLVVLVNLLISLSNSEVQELQGTNQCQVYLVQLANLYNNNQTQFIKTMATYMLFSGKQLEDMGFPSSCLKNPSLNYWTATLNIQQQINSNNLTAYYGLCFTNICNSQTLNSQSNFFIDYIFQNMTSYKINSISFQNINMQVQYTPQSIIICIIIALFILFRMTDRFLRWGKLCAADSQEQVLAVQAQDNLNQNEAGRMPQNHLSFIQKFSLWEAFKRILQKEQTNKILSFSLFKLFSIPLVVYGYQFYLNNFGSYNYFIIDKEVYPSFYAKAAVFAYYLPDIFFFISGYLYSKKLIRIDESFDDKYTQIIKSFFIKMLKIYPVYIMTIIIYWVVGPTLHAGPLWPIYQSHAQECNSTWWRSFLMIDNYFINGCYKYSWYIQLQFQYLIIISLVFMIYAAKRQIANIILALLTIFAFIIVFVFGGKLPVSIQTAISSQSQLYLHSIYSHLFFYLFGTIIAFTFDKQSVKSFVKENIIKNYTIITTLVVLAFSLLIFIIIRPSIWYNSLVLELAFSRIGVIISFLIFFTPDLVQLQTRLTYIHKLANLSYPIILFNGMIAASGFWALNYFAYTSQVNLITTSVTTLILSVIFGGFIGILFDFSCLIHKK